MKKMEKAIPSVDSVEPMEPHKLSGCGEVISGFLVINGGKPDDRVLCDDCQHLGSKNVVQRFTSEQFERIRKINHPAFRWMFNNVNIQDDWRVVKYQENICKKNLTLVLSVKQRCYSFKQKVEVGSDNWFEELSENLTDNKNIEKTKVGSVNETHRTHGTGQAGHVAQGVLPRPDGGSDTQWWD